MECVHSACWWWARTTIPCRVLPWPPTAEKLLMLLVVVVVDSVASLFDHVAIAADAVELSVTSRELVSVMDYCHL